MTKARVSDEALARIVARTPAEFECDATAFENLAMDLRETRLSVAELSDCLVGALAVIEGQPTGNPLRVPTALRIRGLLARVAEGGAAVSARQTTGDNGARLALGLASEDLERLEHFLGERVDQDAAETRHYQAVRRVRALLIRMRDGKALPTTYPVYAMNGEDL